MGVFRNRQAGLALLVLATMGFAGLVVEGHDPLELSIGHEDLPTFSAGHEQRDRTLHVESATPLELASCDACLQRQRERTDDRLAPLSGHLELAATIVAAEIARPVAHDPSRLPAPRAPPAA